MISTFKCLKCGFGILFSSGAMRRRVCSTCGTKLEVIIKEGEIVGIKKVGDEQ